MRTRTPSSGWPGSATWSRPASSPLSRNRSFGEELAEDIRSQRSPSVDAASRQSQILRIDHAELAAKHNIEMLIVENVAAVIAGELTPAEMITALMSRLRPSPSAY